MHFLSKEKWASFLCELIIIWGWVKTRLSISKQFVESVFYLVKILISTVPYFLIISYPEIKLDRKLHQTSQTSSIVTVVLKFLLYLTFLVSLDKLYCLKDSSVRWFCCLLEQMLEGYLGSNIFFIWVESLLGCGQTCVTKCQWLRRLVTLGAFSVGA